MELSIPYRNVTLNRISQSNSKISEETRYWKKYRKSLFIKEFSSIHSISVSPKSPYDMALTTSNRVQIYSYHDRSLKSSYSKFGDSVLCCSYRSDGRLLAASDNSGKIQIFDAQKKTELRRFDAHQRPCYVTKFFGDNCHLLSGSDDSILNVWDIPAEKKVFAYQGHLDYIRSAAMAYNDFNVFASGSYDHTVKLWDRRNNECILSIDHGAPVESVLFFPGNNMIVAAGMNYFGIYDLLNGGKQQIKVSHHQKTITSLCFNADYSRLLTGSLDQHVKIVDVNDYSAVHSIKYPSPILSLAMTPDDAFIIAGMTNGYLSMKERQKNVPVVEKQETYRVGSQKYYERGANSKPQNNDLQVPQEKRQKLKSYDKYLKKFQYRNALDAALQTKSAIIAMNVIDELILRDALHVAISDRDDKSLSNLLEFLNKNINHPDYSKVLIAISENILELYSSRIGSSVVIDELLCKMRNSIKDEMFLQKKLFEIKGAMDMLINRSMMNKP